eukprot:6458446-Amphidinium_carterae.1
MHLHAISQTDVQSTCPNGGKSETHLSKQTEPRSRETSISAAQAPATWLVMLVPQGRDQSTRKRQQETTAGLRQADQRSRH